MMTTTPEAILCRGCGGPLADPISRDLGTCGPCAHVPPAACFRPCRLFLRDPLGIAPYERDGAALIDASGWVEFVPAGPAPLDVAAVSYPPAAVLRVEWREVRR